MFNYNFGDNLYYSIVNKSDIHVYNTSNRIETDQARVVLNDMLNHFNVDIDEIIIDDNGKPYFKKSNIFFNYSHSKNYIACVISNYEVGIDIEEKTRNISDDISKKYLNGVEGNNDKLIQWIKKESYSKLKGLGLQIGFSNLKYDCNCKNLLINEDEFICSIFCSYDNIKFNNLKF
ncbi:MAG: hypothetical protein IKE89_01975 [Bacilli bacterium]|nr:hypothetical protein [Bacilli bacterium]